jgi:hypothetical protein
MHLGTYSLIVVTSKHDSPYGCAVGQFRQVSTRDNSFCPHLNESAYIVGEIHVRVVQLSVGNLRKNVSLKKMLLPPSVHLLSFWVCSKQKNTAPEWCKDVPFEHSTQKYLPLSLLSSEQGRNLNVGKFL